MRISFLITLLAAALAGCMSVYDSRTVHGSGQVVTEHRAVSGFDQVSVSGAGELALIQGDEESLSIETDDNLLPLIDAAVHNGHLSIGPRNVNLRPTQSVRYRLKLRNVRQVRLSGAVGAKAESLTAERLSLGISGAGNIHLAHLAAGLLSTEISGAGEMSVAGLAERQIINISGAGKHDAHDLRTVRTEARISGAGHASVWATEALSAQISGSGAIEYRGRPAVDSHISGAGQIRQRGDGE
jgi:hypothetical protein